MDPGIYESSKNLSSLTSKSKENLNLSHSTLPSKRQHSALKAKALEGEGPFSNHCRSFDSQIKVNLLINIQIKGGQTFYQIIKNRKTYFMMGQYY